MYEGGSQYTSIAQKVLLNDKIYKYPAKELDELLRKKSF